ncbi:MAG: metal ABC transporter substrate-binding protein [Chloroflexota bacterium]
MTGRRTLAGAAALVVATVLLGGCRAAPANPDAHVRVVATTTILADLVGSVGGPLVSVESLVPKGGEVHTFDPKPSDVRRLVEADLVVRNGLGLDDWLATLVRDAGSTAPVVVLGEDLTGATYIHEGKSVNPHLWLDVAYARLYAARILDALVTADPADADAFRANAATYDATLAALDAEIRADLSGIPEADRTVVAFHDAFPYFAAAYGLVIDGTIVDAPGQDPSAAQVAALVNSINDGNIHAIFSEAQFNPSLAQAIAAETKAVVVTDLYTDSVGDPPLDSYVALLRWDAQRVSEALRAP